MPEPMLARPGPVPAGNAWAFEPKLDGFRCMVDTRDGFRARSRRGWNMTALLPELAAAIPPGLLLDGELVAWDAAGRPDFHRLTRRMLHGDRRIGVCLVAFDLLAADGRSLVDAPYTLRRQRLEEQELESALCRTVAVFEDGAALYAVVCEQGLEGVVAKRLTEPYRPGLRSWVKTKNRATRRFAQELAGARRRAGLSTQLSTVYVGR
jgi:bifunctional non-homologous end joining protein LigD